MAGWRWAFARTSCNMSVHPNPHPYNNNNMNIELEDKRYIERMMGYGSSPLLSWMSDDDVYHKEVEIEHSLVKEVAQEEVYIEVELTDEGFTVNGELCELDINGEPRIVTFEWIGGHVEDHDMVQTFKREEIYRTYRDRFMGASWKESEANEHIFASDAYCKMVDIKEKAKAKEKEKSKKRKLYVKINIKW
jgi:hypothetical protein